MTKWTPQQKKGGKKALCRWRGERPKGAKNTPTGAIEGPRQVEKYCGGSQGPQEAVAPQNR